MGEFVKYYDDWMVWERVAGWILVRYIRLRSYLFYYRRFANAFLGSTIVYAEGIKYFINVLNFACTQFPSCGAVAIVPVPSVPRRKSLRILRILRNVVKEKVEETKKEKEVKTSIDWSIEHSLTPIRQPVSWISTNLLVGNVLDGLGKEVEFRRYVVGGSGYYEDQPFVAVAENFFTAKECTELVRVWPHPVILFSIAVYLSTTRHA